MYASTVYIKKQIIIQAKINITNTGHYKDELKQYNYKFDDSHQIILVSSIHQS